MADALTIRLPDGSERELPAGATATDLATSIGSRLAKAAVIAGVNGERAGPRDWSSPTVTRSPSSPPRATPACSRSATPPPTCSPRRCSTCSPAPRSPSARRSRTASTTTSSCPTAGTFSRRRPRAHRGPHAGDHQGVATVRPRRARQRPGPARSSPSTATSSRSSTAPADGPDVGHVVDRARCAPTRTRRRPRRRPRRSPGTRASSTCAAARTCRHEPPPRPLQAHAGRRRLLAGRREERRCCSASTARPGRRRPPSTSTSHRLEEAAKRDHRKLGDGARPASASPTSSAAGWRCGTPRAPSCAS